MNLGEIGIFGIFLLRLNQWVVNMGMGQPRRWENEGRIRSGRRKAVDIDSPRDRTVCFLVSEEEKEAIDIMSVAIGRTRSAVLARMAVGFISAVFAEGDGDPQVKELEELCRQCREAISNHPILKDRK